MDNDAKIVTQPCKIDLHIHSAASTLTKDIGNKELSACTKGELGALISKLDKNDINVCSITDHDYFDYELYKALKSREGEGALRKVLPGVEFSVAFKSDFSNSSNNNRNKKEPDEGKRTVIHIVAVFDDRNSDDKLSKLQSIICDSKGKPKYDDKEKLAFSEKRFTDLIRETELNVILIGHEKSAGQESKADVSSLGAEKANDVILTEFVDAVEIRNRRKELDIKKLIETYSKDRVPFVIGSDCHDWNVYPYKDKTFVHRSDEVAFTTIKCLPTFEGLLMAVTDPSRIRVGEVAFFNSGAPILESLDLKIYDDAFQVPLSPGINAIIGDNSIGKSLLIHALTGYKHLSNDSGLKQGYKEYCNRESLTIASSITESMEFKFDDQGSVKRTLEELHDNTGSTSYFDRFFQRHVDLNGIRESLKRFFYESLAALKSKASYNDALTQLNSLEIRLKIVPKSDILNITKIPKKVSFTEVDDFVSRLNSELATIKSIRTDHSNLIKKIGKAANTSFDEIIKELNNLLALAKEHKRYLEIENIKTNAITASAQKEKARLKNLKTDEERQSDVYSEELSNIAQNIANAVMLKSKRKNKTFEFLPSLKLQEPTPMGDFIFVSEVEPDISKKDYCRRQIDTIFNKSQVPEIIKGIESDTTMTTLDIANAVANIKPSPKECFSYIESKLDEIVDGVHESLKITNEAIGIKSKPSPGLYGRLYFELLAEDDSNFGIYLIDQPEDQISQMAIKERVLDAFKRMSANRQILMITHNPQFVVNLDVDNVIAFGRDEVTNAITVKSGALEFESDDYKMLDIVANTVEGGADVVRKRLKRYGSEAN